MVQATRRNFAFSAAQMDAFFEFYNMYLAPSHDPEKQTCGACRTKVVGVLRRITEDERFIL